MASPCIEPIQKMKDDNVIVIDPDRSVPATSGWRSQPPGTCPQEPTLAAALFAPRGGSLLVGSCVCVVWVRSCALLRVRACVLECVQWLLPLVLVRPLALRLERFPQRLHLGSPSVPFPQRVPRQLAQGIAVHVAQAAVGTLSNTTAATTAAAAAATHAATAAIVVATAGATTALEAPYECREKLLLLLLVAAPRFSPARFLGGVLLSLGQFLPRCSRQQGQHQRRRRRRPWSRKRSWSSSNSSSRSSS